MDELQFLMNFNASITQAAVKTMEHLSEFVFMSMGNLTLACRDAYLNHIKGGVKPDTVAAFRTAPLHIPTLFPDSIIKQAEEEIAHFEAKGQSSLRGKCRYPPMSVQRKGQIKGRIPRVTDPLGRTLGKVVTRNPRGSLPVIHRDQPRASSPINDNYCIEMLRGSTTSCLYLYHWYRIPWPQQWTLSVCHGRIWTDMPSHQQPSWAKW